MENFNPILRFVAVSDVHYKNERSKETERMEKAMNAAYRIAENHPTYKNLDALVVVGDFDNELQTALANALLVVRKQCL